MWDGGSPSYYTDDWNDRTDFTVHSPQIEFMNADFMLREAQRLNPAYWFELSIWDGYDTVPGHARQRPTKRDIYHKLGQVYDPERYGGWVQFGMWLLRPRSANSAAGSFRRRKACRISRPFWPT